MPITNIQTIDTGIKGHRRVSYFLTDHSGAIHRIPTRKVADNFDAAADGQLRAQRKEKELAMLEEESYFATILAGGDPSNTTPQHQTKADILKKLLKRILRLDKAEIAENLTALKFLVKITDTQFKNILQISDAQVAHIRARQTEMLSVQAVIASHTPILEVG